MMINKRKLFIPFLALLGASTISSAQTSDWQRTVIFIYGETVNGQDMFIRGGIDHGYANSQLGRNCQTTNFECAIPIQHNNWLNDTTAPWKANDTHLDWYGSEVNQDNASEGTALDWTTNSWPADWGPKVTVADDGVGEEPLNRWGHHYWMLDVEMDCSKTVDGWFELKSYISNGPGWEADANQSGTPYASGNHFARCGYLNKFERGSSAALIEALPQEDNRPGDFLSPRNRDGSVSNRCLTYQGDLTSAGAQVITKECTGEDKHRWTMDENNQIHPLANETYCLSIPNYGYLVDFFLVPCDASHYQNWAYDANDNTIANAGWALDFVSNTQTATWSFNNSSNQKWLWAKDAAALAQQQSAIQVNYPLYTSNSDNVALEDARHRTNYFADLNSNLIPRDVSNFPGIVESTTTRVSEQFNFDRNFADASNYAWEQKPKNWMSTGLYAAAGDVITITVNTANQNDTDGLYARINVHTDILPDSKTKFDRFRTVTKLIKLVPGENKVRSQYGGLIVLISETSVNTNVSIGISGAVKAPYFKLGETSAQDWLSIRNNPAPWAEIEGEKAIVAVPSSTLRNLEDPTSIIQTYDDIVALSEELAGFDGSSSAHPLLEGKQRFVDDVQISAGYGHAGFPIMVSPGWNLLGNNGTGWGNYHETGHNYQQFCLWASRFGSESTVNLFSAYIQEAFGEQSRFELENRYSKAVAKLATGGTFDDDMDVWEKAIFMMQIRHAFPQQGWDIFKDLHKAYRELSETEQRNICGSNALQVDKAYELLSLITGYDLKNHFTKWGFSLSSGALSNVSNMGLENPAIDVSAVNPE